MFIHPIQPSKWKPKMLLDGNFRFCDWNLTMIIFSMVLHFFSCTSPDTKIREPYVVSSINYVPILEWYMTKFIVENKHQKDVCHNEIVTCVQKVDT